MANELNINLSSFTFAKNNIAINISPSPNPLAVTVTGLHSVHDQIGLTTGDTTITKGNISTLGYLYFRNLDLTQTITVGDGVQSPVTLKPGDIALVRWNSAAVHATALSGTPTLEYMFIED